MAMCFSTDFKRSCAIFCSEAVHQGLLALVVVCPTPSQSSALPNASLFAALLDLSRPSAASSTQSLSRKLEPAYGTNRSPALLGECEAGR
jgi:hypothetical protein